jgi:hypothetical protein
LCNYELFEDVIAEFGQKYPTLMHYITAFEAYWGMELNLHVFLDLVIRWSGVISRTLQPSLQLEKSPSMPWR